jgi:predicted O-linked N-acetylglucosamine transferase (SPINDLY family)
LWCAVALQPDFAAAHHNRGNALQRLKRFDDALASYDRALAARPDYPEALNARALALQELKRHDEALTACERAIAARPGYPEALYLRGSILRAMNRSEDARAAYAAALAARPGYAEARLARCMAELPILYRDAAEIDACRAAYERELRALAAEVASGKVGDDLAGAIGSNLPFFLAYQGRNDRELQRVYGEMVCRLVSARFGPAPIAPPPSAGEKLRVGIVSGYFSQHSNWKQPISGWLDQLDRARFRLFGYHTSGRTDAATRKAASLCERFVQGPLPHGRWRQEILHDGPHVLIYPEIGMDSTVPTLAAQRLARVQCSFWGHPETSGMPTVDYFLSSALMEPDDGDAHYTERLVRLPNLSIYYEPIVPPPLPLTRAQYGLRRDAVVYWCCQSLFKYLPQYDEVFAHIARAAGRDVQFAFIENPGSQHITRLFRGRLAPHFAEAGLDVDRHCVFLPRLDMREFVAAAGLCDVYLDSPGWSGGNTTLECLVHDLPVVTLPGSTMRSRHSTAILTMMGVGETIAADLGDYVEIAARLAREPAWRAAMKGKMSANKHRVYRDRTSIDALEAFLERAVAERASS